MDKNLFEYIEYLVRLSRIQEAYYLVEKLTTKEYIAYRTWYNEIHHEAPRKLEQSKTRI